MRSLFLSVVTLGLTFAACGGQTFTVSSGSGGAAGAAGAGAGGSGMCAAPTHLTLAAACATCLETSCCADLTACDGDAACPACTTTPAACSTGPFVGLKACAQAACGTECAFATGGGAAACLTFAGYGNLNSDNCTKCINDVCHADGIQSVCGKNPADACNNNCGNNATCFCDCMANRPAPCGTKVASTYACFTAKCASECN